MAPRSEQEAFSFPYDIQQTTKDCTHIEHIHQHQVHRTLVPELKVVTGQMDQQIWMSHGLVPVT